MGKNVRDWPICGGTTCRGNRFGLSKEVEGERATILVATMRREI